MRERTLSIIKPNATAKGVAGQILSRFEKEGFGIVAVKQMSLSKKKAAGFYEHTIAAMCSLIAEMQTYKERREPIPARIMWKLGDSIFRLKNQLETLSLQLDGIYAHLIRDLGVKREWLEKVIIFRRYLLREDLIPQSLNWSRCYREIRRTAERLQKGLPLD